MFDFFKKKKDENIEKRSSDDYTLHHKIVRAIRNNDIDKVSTLLNNGVNPNFVYMNRRIVGTSLYVAISVGSYDIVKLLLEKGANPNNFNFLGSACKNQNLKLIKLLIEYKANINLVGDNGRIALFDAIEVTRASKEIIRYLIQSGADVHQKDDKGISPLSFAETNKKSLVKVLTENLEVSLDEALGSQTEVCLKKLTEQNKIINKLKDEVKSIKNKLILNETKTKNSIENLLSKINKLEQKFDKQKVMKIPIPLNIVTEKESIKKDDGVIVKRESFDDF